MPVTQTLIREWLQAAKERGCSHLIVACDTFDYEDYPVFVRTGQSASAEIARLNGKNMTKVMECYSLALDWDAQYNEPRAFHVE